ncbi:MAG: hypothetical protein GOU98_02315 [Candidatus Altiarchaeota archaeon]|nr:hypothetical protein [Candidatus Altiarchaeota archaeon]
MAVELLILVFFAVVGVILMKVLMGNNEPEFVGPPPQGMYGGPSQYGGMTPYPPMQGYYQPRAKKQRILIMPESTVKSKKRRRRI